MRLHILGCAGAELPKHNMPGFLVDRTVLLDAGTIGLALDFQDQRAIEHIFITHAHLDHSGLIARSVAEIPIYATTGTSKMLLAGSIFARQRSTCPPPLRSTTIW